MSKIISISSAEYHFFLGSNLSNITSYFYFNIFYFLGSKSRHSATSKYCSNPFTRPKLGKLHEASCMFCQKAPGHHELKEACKAFEKVLVQNLQFGLSISLTDAIKSIPRWRLVQAAFPHILHCTSSLLHNRKDTNLQNLGTSESKLLYILHWIILDAAEECAEADYEKGIYQASPFYYLFSIPCITLFVYLLAPLCHQVKEGDLQTFRLENGVKLWHPLWEYRHPDARCFTALCKPKPQAWPQSSKLQKSHETTLTFVERKTPTGEVYLTTDSPPSQTASIGFFETSAPSKNIEDEGWVSSPKDTVFPETIPEESSSTEEEHVVIFRLPSLADSEGLKESIYTAPDATIFQVPNRFLKSPTDIPLESNVKSGINGRQSSVDKESILSTRTCAIETSSAATFLDVAVLRCLFIAQWPEEGVYWALQFLYHRLRDVVETNRLEPEQRKRSNSLPSPSIPFSFESNELTKVEKDFIEVPEIKDVNVLAEYFPGAPPSSFNQKETGHSRRASEKLKKCMKMADLKAFVETKLLSKSEKALEKIGHDDKNLYPQECHRSLDTGDEHLVRMEHAFSKLLDPNQRGSTNLVKGKSMPSLSCLIDDSVHNGVGYMGETRREWVLETSPNPIITVTEHTPVPSPEFMRHKGTPNGHNGERKSKRRLTRSYSDSNVAYSVDDCPEAPGSSYYITQEGDIDLLVVLKGIQSVVIRDKVICTLRVCEGILNVIEVVLGMAVLSEESDKQNVAHTCVLTCLTRVLRHLGCPHGCGDSQRGPPADFLRSQVHTLLSKLHRTGTKHFTRFFKHMVSTLSIADIIDFFHSYTGFCVDPSSLLSPLNQKRGCNKSPDAISQGTFGPFTTPSISTGVEGHIMSYVFKKLITKLVAANKEIKSQQENMNLYCDIRQLMSYVKEVHANVLRRVAMSGLIDTAIRPHRKQSNLQTTRVIRHIPQSEQSEESMEPCYIVEEKDTKKLLFKKRSTSSTCAVSAVQPFFSLCKSVLEADIGEEIQSPLGNMRKKHHILTPRHSQRNFTNLHKNSRFHIGGLVNWFRKEYKRGDSVDSQGSVDLPSEGALVHHAAQLHHSYSKTSQKSTSSVGTTLQKAKRRVEDQFTKFGFGKGKKKDGSIEETQGSYLSRRNSVEMAEGRSRDCEVVVLKTRRLVRKDALLNGMMRFSLLLEICQPATLPHPHLLAASLDLPHTPVVSRAAFLLECAHFVHLCNKGQWPSWLKQNLPLFRPSGPPATNRPNSNNTRKSHILQRTAGNMFYQWAEALGQRLEEMLADDKSQIPIVISILSDECKQKELLIEDEEEDFLDEATKTSYGSVCPMALRLIACVLLMEITAFLRETYQTIPKVGHTSGRSGTDKPQSWTVVDKGYSKEANRRWSMALSSMGHSQASAQSLQSIVGDKADVFVGLQSERKISFVLQEPDNESEGSSNTTLPIQPEDVVCDDKKVRSRRPLLLRRGTATTTVTTGSFKRRSLKLRRPKEQMPIVPASAERPKESISEINEFRRGDSIQNKRKVSSLSDRSDTSEQGGAGEVSGEESPGVLSDDQPPESPTDTSDTDDTTNMPWIKVIVQMLNSYNYYCSHQNFCHPFCYRRHMRAASRLIKAVRQVYGEEFGVMNNENSTTQEEPKKSEGKRSRKVSEQASPVKSKDSKKDKDKDKLERIGGDSTLTGKDGNKGSDDKGNLSKGGKGSGDKSKDPSPMLKYIKTQVDEVFHCLTGTVLKGGCITPGEILADCLPAAWQLLLEPCQQTAASAAALMILAAVKAPAQAAHIMDAALRHPDPAVRINAVLRFKVLWKMRHQVWCRLEEGAQMSFKVPPPGIEFTLPSPKIGIESLPVVDPPWMPLVKTKVEEVTAISQESHRSLVTATKTRKKQQTELIKMALQAREDKKRSERENFMVTTIPITTQAAYEPSLHHAVGDDHDEGGDEEVVDGQPRNATSHHIHSAQSLFPSCLCSAVIQIINLLDDAAVSNDGCAVYEVAYQVIWNCLVEDSALFLRYILERLTRDNQELMFKVLRHLIRFVPRLPQQAAFTLYNYIIGYVMFYVRTPHEEGQKLIGAALSILWMVVHSVHGIMFKDLKQILRKEQCDASILLTANVPSTKKIIVHGPQEQSSCGIPSQFPVQEDTQFCQILRESLDFFGIDEDRHKEFFLVDHKTRQIHNPNSYVRDYYFFKRSQYPQLELVHMHPQEAFNALQKQELMHKVVEIGKVLLTWAILKNVDMVVQRVVFLHEELMKLPSFPRKALEADLDLYKGGDIGKELLGLDVLHKFMWVRLIARMFEAMAGNFAYSGDIHLFLNVLNGAVTLHSQDATILRYVMATYINAAHNFKNIFSINGYLMIIPSLLQLYASHQTNKLVTRTVEYVVKQFYLMNRKPFILQMFGAASAILDIDAISQFGDAHKVPAICLFRILLSLETPSPDPLNIGELVKEEKPLQAIDFCYHDDSEMVTVLDCISLCVMVVAYAADSVRAYQMLTILEAIVPCYLLQIQQPSYRKEGKTERDVISQIAVAINTLITNCEALSKNYNGPQRTSPDHKGSSQRNYNRNPYSPGYEYDDDTHAKYIQDRSKMRTTYGDSDDSEAEFRRPRDVLLSLATEFATKCSARLIELNKKFPQDGKPIELVELRSQIRLAEVAHSLLKASPYDPDTMSCKGLQLYMTQLMPVTEWSNESMRPSLIMLLRRLDKTFSKIYKKASIRRSVDWEAASGLIRGVYETLSRYPYMVHMQHLKTLVSTCQSLIIGETATGLGENVSSATTALMSQVPPPHFCDIVVRLIALQILVVGETYTLEQVCGGSTLFPTHEKTENMLMNLLIPLSLRVGSGRKDVHIMREVDIQYTLTTVLYAMYPPSARSPITMQNFKMATDFRTSSFSFTKSPPAVTKSLYQVSFLALKILIVCFECELEKDWPRIARTVQELSKVTDARQYFWSFIEFVVTQRPPLFVLMQPFIKIKLNMTPLSDVERHIHFVVRERMSGLCLSGPKCRGALLHDLIQEMKTLKEELENKKYKEQTAASKAEAQAAQAPDMPPPTVTARHRPSLIDLLTGASQPPGSHVPAHRESVSSVPSSNTQEPPIAASLARHHTSSEITSPAEEGSNESDKPSRPRLQRSKAQSRKTFRLRKSRIENAHRSEPAIFKECENTGEGGEEETQVPDSKEDTTTVKTPLSAPPVPSPAIAIAEGLLNSAAGNGGTASGGSQTNGSSVGSSGTTGLGPGSGAGGRGWRVARGLLRTDRSWDEDMSQTSSTSGYRENCSLVMMPLERQQLTSSSTVVPGTTSPDSSDLAHSRHSLLMVFDEDTLI
ncbi:unc80, NALCN channel complex subunit isoform X3 [Rhodnius prolixus]|uniref:unc80, NALCN channel complex subunit isoform X3 n=1 Tax=Rhodnius prolixus TaxID=13249 RepID=UPI003D18B785